MGSLTEVGFKKLQSRFTKEFFEDPVSQNFMSNKDFIHSFVEKYPKHHFLATPLFEIFSIRISNHTAIDGVPYQVYGTIQVTDGQGVMFTIYDRNDNIPDVVSNGDSLTLVLPKGRPITITPSNTVTLNIALRARIGDRNEEIINERHTWYYKTIDDFDKVETNTINGVCGTAVVDYVSYRHAIFASVEVLLFKETDDETYNSARVYGRIVANCGDRYSTVLFDQKQDNFVVVKYGTCAEISTHVVVVPAWSSFTIYTDLWSANTNQQFVNETDGQSHDVPLTHDLPYTIELMGQNEFIALRVMWGHADLEQPTLQRKVEKASDAENIIFPVTSEYDVIADQQTLMSLNNRRNWLSCFSHLSSLEVWEVFSISVYRNSGEVLNLWGSIDVDMFPYSESIFTIFESKSPQRLLPKQSIPIRYPPRCIQSPAVMTFNLIGDHGHVISKGDICWDDPTFDMCTSCLNRLLCSVVQGDDGYYATVHYTIFPEALQAKVRICLIDKTSSLRDTKVNGCIHAEYKEFTYATPWENESYRRKLFVGRPEEPLLEFSDSEIQLSECGIAVGVGFTLVIDVDLVVISHHDKIKIDEMVEGGETFKQQLQFRPEMGCKEITLERESHQIGVSVEWSGIR